MSNVQETVKASTFRKHLFSWLDACKTRPVIIERGKERFRLVPEGRRKALGTAPLPGLVTDPDNLEDCKPASWNPDDLS